MPPCCTYWIVARVHATHTISICAVRGWLTNEYVSMTAGIYKKTLISMYQHCCLVKDLYHLVLLRTVFLSWREQQKTLPLNMMIHNAQKGDWAFMLLACILPWKALWLKGHVGDSCQCEHQAQKRRESGCTISKVWTACKGLYWVNFALCEIVQFVSLLLLGKLGTRQVFQQVSSPEMAQFTQETQKWCHIHKWQNIEPNVCLSVCPAHNHFCVSSGTRQTRH